LMPKKARKISRENGRNPNGIPSLIGFKINKKNSQASARNVQLRLHRMVCTNHWNSFPIGI